MLLVYLQHFYSALEHQNMPIFLTCCSYYVEIVNVQSKWILFNKALPDSRDLIHY